VVRIHDYPDAKSLIDAMNSLPGAVGMYALSISVQNMDETLPQPVYALLSGLNASTVGIVALSAVQLAEKVIHDRLTRILVIFGACAGLCYNALWYFPVLMIAGGLVTVIWDLWIPRLLHKVKTRWRQRTTHPEDAHEEPAAATAIELQEQGDSFLEISSFRGITLKENGPSYPDVFAEQPRPRWLIGQCVSARLYRQG
jgi:hypothetical protein